MNAADVNRRPTAGDDWFRSVGAGELNSADAIEGGAGNDRLTASIADGQNAVTITPALTSVETVSLTITNADVANEEVTLNLRDSTGTTAVNVTLADDTYGTVAGISTAVAVRFLAGGATADAKVTYTGLSTVASGGNDAATVTISDGDLATLNVAGIEILTLNAQGLAGDIDSLNAPALERLVITGGVNDPSVTNETFAVGTAGSAANNGIDFAGLDTGEIAVIDASASTGPISLVVDDSVRLNVTGGAGTLTLLNTSPGATNASGTAAVTVTAGAGALIVTLEGGANTASATALTQVSVTGSASADTIDVTAVVNPTDLSATTAREDRQVNLTVNAGAGNDTIKIDTGVVSIDAGEGDDTVDLVVSSIDAFDTISGGSGTDTILISNATIDASLGTTLAVATGFEVINTTATGAVVANIAGFASADIVRVSGASGLVNAATSGVGYTGIAATVDNSDTLVIAAERKGQQGSATANGGDAVNITPRVDGGSNVATIRFVGNADLAGGAGGTTSGNGGDALDASSIETLNIVVVGTQAANGTADTVELTGGTFTTGQGAAGQTLVVGTNATINISSALEGATAALHNNINLGTVKGLNVAIDASSFAGRLTAVAGDGNVRLTGGSGRDVLTGGNGTDTIVGGAGADILSGRAGVDTLTGGTGRDEFAIDAEGTTNFDTITDFGLATEAATAATVGALTLGTSGNFGTPTSGGGAGVDLLDITSSSTLAVRADTTTAVDVSSATSVLGDTVTASVTRGILTLGGADRANIDTLAEWISAAEIVAATAGNAVAFEFGGDTYVYVNDTTDVLVMLDNLTGATNLVLAGTQTALAVGGILIG